MKIKTQELLNKLESIRSICTNKDFAGLSNKLFFTNDKKIFVYDGKMFIETVFDFEIKKSFAIEEDMLYKTLKKLNNKIIEINIEDTKLIINSKNIKIELLIRHEVPDIQTNCQNWQTLPIDFFDAVRLTRFCINTNTIDASAYLSIIDNKMYCTDKFRICRFLFNSDISDMMLPYFCLDTIIQTDCTEYSIENDAFYLFQSEDIKIGILKSKIVPLDFTKYIDIFNAEAKNIISLPDDIKHNIEISELFTDQNSILQKEISITFEKEFMICKAATEKGAAEIKIPFKNNLNISFRIHPIFLLQILKISSNMEIIDDIALFRTDNFCYFFRIGL